ncbi:hypothetical protein OG896_28840 [Streptomyces sp. NBC_00669]|uniref:hypothetical protein n=1 Tax=Streptomyces sp. NBC_00669 TaxID=2976011 RepID=UPI002E2F40F9|nr:hypothetical protein [Streptomyces sp. NBC_00669]
MTFELEPTEDVDEVADILTSAFHEDPVIGWMVPHELPGRDVYVKGFMHAWVRFMLDHEGTALMSPGRDATLVWEPSEREPITAADQEAFEAAITAVTGPAAGRCRQLIDLLDAHYPTDLPPHVHGALAAVRPGSSSPGAFVRLAGAMMLHLYRNGLGVYCEASSESSSALWQRFGSLPIRPPILLPGTDIALTPLYMSIEDITRHPALPVLLGDHQPLTA